MGKLLIFLVVFGVGGTAAYEFARETEPAPVAPARGEMPVAPRPYMQLPGDSDNHPVSLAFAQMYPGWRFRSEHLRYAPVMSISTNAPGPGETVIVYGTGPAGLGGPSRGTHPHSWELVSSSGPEETWKFFWPPSYKLP